MPVIIPSKNIYDHNNSKIINNDYDGIEFNTKYINKKTSAMYNLYLYPYNKSADLNDVSAEYNLDNSILKESAITSYQIKYDSRNDRNYLILELNVNTSSIFNSGTPTKKITQVLVDNVSSFGIDDNTNQYVDSIFDENYFNSISKEIPYYNQFDSFVDSATSAIASNDINFCYSTQILDIKSRIYLAFPYYKGYENAGAGSANVKNYLSSISICCYCDELIFTDNIVKKGSGSNIFSIDSTTLINNTTKIAGEYASDALSTLLYNEYKNGKETATLKCSISNYYDIDGNICLSKTIANKMLFNIGDIVIPYVLSPKGDIPMSTKRDGSAKKFLVTGVGLESDGVLWQNLTLQETDVD